MELTPPVQRTRKNKNTINGSTKDNRGNSDRPISYLMNKNAKIYHPPTDMLREKMISELRRDVGTSSPFNVPASPIDSDVASPKIDAKKYSYTSLSSLNRRKIITNDEYLDAKAVKAGFKSHYERVLTRYSEVLRQLKSNCFRNAKEKSKILMRVRGMEKYLKEVENMKNSRFKSDCSVVGDCMNYQMQAIGCHS